MLHHRGYNDKRIVTVILGTISKERCKRVLEFYLIFLSTITFGSALAEDAPNKEGTQVKVYQFRAISDLNYVPVPLLEKPEILLKNGRIQDPHEWPASFVLVHSNKPPCTSTMVGPEALLVAAHCVPDGASIVLNKGGATHKGTCSHAPGYKDRECVVDVALCALEKPIESILYEVIATAPTSLRKDESILLTGFGCTEFGQTQSGGHFRAGEARVARWPEAENKCALISGEVVTCNGDSGSGAFKVVSSQWSYRVLVGVNSYGMGQHTSKISSLGVPLAREFISQWSSETGKEVCGYTENVAGCRKVAPDPVR